MMRSPLIRVAWMHWDPDRWPSGRRRLLGKQVTSNGVRGFESHPVRHFFTMAVRIGSFATTSCKPRQARKGAAVASMSGAEVRLVRAASKDFLAKDRRIS